VDAARREGVVTVIGTGGVEVRDALGVGFEKAYGIRVEFQSMRGAEIPPRVGAEREAGQYLWDVYVGGTSQALNSLIPMGALEPLEPALILPEARNPASWRGGALPFRDAEGRLLVMMAIQRGIIFVNPNNVRTDEFHSYQDLLDPRWRGRIVADDPRVGGPGQGTFTLFYMHPDLGPEFIRRLAQQDLLLLRDYRQQVDQVAQGQRLILLGTSDNEVENLIKQGLPIAIVDPTQMKEGTVMTAGSGNLGLFNRAPHPSAAQLYANWLLTREAQTDHARALGYISNRVDVPIDHTLPWRVPVPGVLDVEALDVVEIRTTKLVALLEEVFGK
jgi:ABC-type Fe3+ transport system substrate-binding protein